MRGHDVDTLLVAFTEDVPMRKRFTHTLAAFCALLVFTCTPSWAASSGYTQTKYPIVLVHGIFGAETLAGVPYFYQIPSNLSKDGAQVYEVNLSALNNDVVRGEQLLALVQQILATSGAAKVNLIAHSQGGLDSRYVAAVRPDLVASVTSVNTPHKGSSVADVVLGVFPNGTLSQKVFTSIVNAFGQLIELLAGANGLPQDSAEALNALTTAGTAEFNAAYPQGLPTTDCGSGAPLVNGVHYYSWGGTGVLTNVLDLSDVLLGTTSLAFLGSPNDGLVGQCSNHFGQVIADNYFQNHIDAVNNILGLVSLFTTNPVELYRQQANRLKNAGL